MQLSREDLKKKIQELEQKLISMESELSSERIFRGAQMRRELNTPLIFQKYYGYKIKKDRIG